MKRLAQMLRTLYRKIICDGWIYDDQPRRIERRRAPR